MRISTLIGLSTVVVGILISGLTGWQLVRFEAQRSARHVVAAQQDAWEDFSGRYPRLLEQLERELERWRATMSAELENLVPSPTLLASFVEKGVEDPRFRQLLCDPNGPAIFSLQPQEGPPSTYLFTGRSAQEATLVRREGDSKLHLQIGTHTFVAEPFQSAGACTDDLAQMKGRYHLWQTYTPPPETAPWIRMDHLPWHQLSRLLIEGPPELVLSDLEEDKIVVLRRSSVVNQQALSAQTAPGALGADVSNDRRTLLLTMRKEVAGARALTIGFDLEARLATLSSTLGFPVIANFNGWIFFGGAPFSPAERLELVSLLQQPYESIETYGQLQVGGQLTYFAQFIPLEKNSLRLLLLDRPLRPQSFLGARMEEIATRKQGLRQHTIWTASVTALLMGLWGIILGIWLGRPLRTINRYIDMLRAGEALPSAELSSSYIDEVAGLMRACRDLEEANEQRERLQRVLDSFIAAPVAKRLREGVIHAGGGRYHCALLFCDIRGFTQTTRDMRAEEVVVFLNSLFEKISPAVEKHRGMIDKYVGDEIMAIFGAPERLEEPEQAGLAAAMEMRSALEALNVERTARALAPIQMGWGLASGWVTAGVIGSKGRSNYTALGSMVNLASRLCSQAGPMEILCAADFVAAADPTLLTHIEQSTFKGIGPVAVVRL